jgi:hypothetical protein
MILFDADGALHDDSPFDGPANTAFPVPARLAGGEASPQQSSATPGSAAAGGLPPAAPYRIWALACPFRKDGTPVLGSFGATIKGVVIIEHATWKRLCDDFPALARANFDVGEFVEIEAGR